MRTIATVATPEIVSSHHSSIGPCADASQSRRICWPVARMFPRESSSWRRNYLWNFGADAYGINSRAPKFDRPVFRRASAIRASPSKGSGRSLGIAIVSLNAEELQLRVAA